MEINHNKNDWKLIKEILKYSNEKSWSLAKNEWKEVERYLLKNEYRTCTCGHYPIREVIIIQNKINEVKLIIGNCCINKISGNDFSIKVNTNKFFNSIRKKKSNKEVINQGFIDKVINEWEHNFMMDIYKKRNLTLKQFNKYNEVNNRLIDYYTR